MARTRCLGPAWIATILIACAEPSPPNVASVQATIDSLLAHHAELFRGKDVAGLLAAYTDSPVVYSNHALPVRGRGALEPFLAAFTHGGDIQSLSYTTEELAVHGDSAWQILRYRVAVQPTGSSDVVADSGAGFALWVRDASGAWRIHRDIFNSSVPLPATPK
jgi:ketosteroid isomerase-like protein